MEELHKELEKYGYIDTIESKKEGLYVTQKDMLLLSDSLFFVDMGYRVLHTYLFAISAPKYDIKGILTLDLNSYHTLGISGFAEKFNIEVEMSWDNVVVRRQYGMRKVLKEEFDPARYILKKGFPDFPSCPYGNTFKMLGYDVETKEYVRLASSILKDKRLKTLKYEE